MNKLIPKITFIILSLTPLCYGAIKKPSKIIKLEPFTNISILCAGTYIIRTEAKNEHYFELDSSTNIDYEVENKNLHIYSQSQEGPIEIALPKASTINIKNHAHVTCDHVEFNKASTIFATDHVHVALKNIAINDTNDEEDIFTIKIQDNATVSMDNIRIPKMVATVINQSTITIHHASIDMVDFLVLNESKAQLTTHSVISDQTITLKKSSVYKAEMVETEDLSIAIHDQNQEESSAHVGTVIDSLTYTGDIRKITYLGKPFVVKTIQ